MAPVHLPCSAVAAGQVELVIPILYLVFLSKLVYLFKRKTNQNKTPNRLIQTLLEAVISRSRFEADVYI